MVLWRWMTSGQYSSSSTYAALQLGQAEVAGTRQVWKARTPNAYLFFLWLALPDSCWMLE
jgi:hypothetical protein